MNPIRQLCCLTAGLSLALAGSAVQAAEEAAPPAAVDAPMAVDESDAPAALPELDESAFPELNYYAATALFLCPVHLPAGYNPQRSYPLVIGLHGYASSPERYHSIYYAFEDPQFIYAAPQAPYPLPMGNALGYSWFTGDENEEVVNESVRLAQQYVIDLIAQLKSQYNISDVYLLGFSQGGALAYITGFKHHELFDGLICFACWLDPQWFEDGEIDMAAGLPLLIAHAEDDPAVEFWKGEEARDQLEARGFAVEFLPFTGGHTLTAEALKQVEIWIETVAASR